MKEIPKKHQLLVIKRIEAGEKNPERLLDWDKVSTLLGKKSTNGFPARKFCGVLKVNEDALVIQKRLRNEWK